MVIRSKTGCGILDQSVDQKVKRMMIKRLYCFRCSDQVRVSRRTNSNNGIVSHSGPVLAPLEPGCIIQHLDPQLLQQEFEADPIDFEGVIVEWSLGNLWVGGEGRVLKEVRDCFMGKGKIISMGLTRGVMTRRDGRSGREARLNSAFWGSRGSRPFLGPERHLRGLFPFGPNLLGMHP